MIRHWQLLLVLLFVGCGFIQEQCLNSRVGSVSAFGVGGLLSEGYYWRASIGGLLSEGYYWRATVGELLLEGYCRRATIGGLLSEGYYWRATIGGLLSEGYYWRATIGGILLEGYCRRATIGGWYLIEEILKFHNENKKKTSFKMVTQTLGQRTIDFCH